MKLSEKCEHGLSDQMSCLQQGDHLCLLYNRDPAEQMPVLLPFIREGLARHEQFIYVADDQTAEELAHLLKDSGIDVEAELACGALKIWTRREWRQQGELSSENKARQLRQICQAALGDGFKGVRFAVEMTWTLGPDISAEKLEHWESTINTIFVPGFPGRIICQYNRSRLGPDVVLASLHTHPLAIVGQDIHVNPFYRAPHTLDPSCRSNGHNEGTSRGQGNGKAAPGQVEWMVAQMGRAREMQRDRENLRRSRESLAEREADESDSDLAQAELHRGMISREKNHGDERNEWKDSLAVELADTKRLHELSGRLLRETELAPLLTEVLHASADLMGTDLGNVQIYDESKKVLNIVAHLGFTQEFLDYFKAVPAGYSICGTALEKQERLIVEDASTDPRFAELAPIYRRFGFVAVQSTPLVGSEGKVLGMMSCHFAKPRRPSEREMRLLDLFAEQAARVIERKAAEKAIARRATEQAALFQLTDRIHRATSFAAVYESALDAILRALDCQRAAILLCDDANVMRFVGWRGLSEGYRQAVEGHSPWRCDEMDPQPVCINDVEGAEIPERLKAIVKGEGIHALAFIPLMASGRLFGKFMAYYDAPHDFTDEEMDLALTIGRQLGVGMEQKRAEEALRASEARMRQLVSLMPAAVYTCDARGRITFFNRRAAELWGGEPAPGEEDRNFCISLWPDGSPLPDEQSPMAKALATGASTRHGEVIIERPDGTRVPVSVNVDPLYDAEGTRCGAINVFQDVTEIKEAEKALRQSREAAQRLAAIVESSDDAIITKDLDGVITSWNKGAQLLFGYTAEEMIGRHITTLIPPGRRDEEPGILGKIARGERIEHYETIRQCKDGTLLNISLTVSPVKDARGKVIGASKIARDITERFRAREKLEQTVAERTAQLRDTVAELEGFSYSVAHDMRAPLRSMNSYSRFLEEDFAPVLPPQALDYVRRIAAGAGRLDALITDVLNYSKISRGEIVLQNVDVEKLTREIIDSYPDLRDSGGVILVQSPIPQVLGNPAALTQVLSNLLTNAVKFVAPGTTPQVRICAERRGEHVRICVADNGIGISDEGQKRIFHMFQRLNPASEFDGTGIGLTIVRKAVERMGGQVGVESQPGRGSRFWFELKRAA